MILELAQRIVKGLPKKGKQPPHLHKKRKRTASTSDFQVAEDPRKSPPVLPDTVSAEFSGCDSRKDVVHLSEATLSKLNAFRYQPSKKQNDPVPITKQSSLPASPRTPKSEDNADKTSDTEKHNIGIKLQTVGKAQELDKSSSLSGILEDEEKCFDEDDSIFDQLIAKLEAENPQAGCTPEAANPHQHPHSTPTSSTPPISPPLLLASTPIYGPPRTPSRIPAQPTPPIKVIFRNSLQSPAPSISPLPSLNGSLRVPTCFRIADALRLLASSPNTFRAIELYATVITSTRITSTQTFQFADLFFPQRPPYLFGRYEGWKESELFDHNAAAFITPYQNTSGSPRSGHHDGAQVELLMCRTIISPASNEKASTSRGQAGK